MPPTPPRATDEDLLALLALASAKMAPCLNWSDRFAAQREAGGQLACALSRLATRLHAQGCLTTLEAHTIRELVDQHYRVTERGIPSAI